MNGEDKKWLLLDLALTYSHNGQKDNAKNTLQELKVNYNLDKDLIAFIENDIAEANVSSQIQANKQTINSESVISVPVEFDIAQNYPNPFNPSTVINYQLPNGGTQFKVLMKVFDILGREIATLADEIKNAGYYTVTFDGSRLSSGVYFVRFIATPQDGSKPFIKTMKMLMMK